MEHPERAAILNGIAAKRRKDKQRVTFALRLSPKLAPHSNPANTLRGAPFNPPGVRYCESHTGLFIGAPAVNH